MTSWYLTLMSALFAVSVQAGASAFSYKTSAGWEHPRRLDLLELQFALREKGLFSLEQKNAGRLTWIPVDQIYVSRDLRQSVFVKFGLEVTDKTKERVLTQMAGGVLYHGRTQDGEPFAVFFQGLPESEVRSIVEILPGDNKIKVESAGHWFEILPSANAEQVARFDEPNAISAASGVLVAASGVASCIGLAWDGAANAARETWHSAQQLITDPIAFWQSVKGKFDEFRDLLAKFNVEMSELVEALANVDSDTAQTVVCTIAGQVAFGGLLMAGAIGAAKGIVDLVKILSQLRLVRQALIAMARLRSAGKVNAAAVRDVVTGVLACATP